MNKIETVILDFDGTIADTKNSIIQTIQATLEILGLPKANDNEIKNLIGLPLEESKQSVNSVLQGRIFL